MDFNKAEKLKFSENWSAAVTICFRAILGPDIRARIVGTLYHDAAKTLVSIGESQACASVCNFLLRERHCD